MSSILADITVVDLSLNAPGPFCSMMLADLGAEVITVTNPAIVAGARYAGSETEPMLGARGSEFDALQRNKQTCAIDLKSQQGMNQLYQLLDRADVLISEMRPGKLESLGLGFDQLNLRNPGLILCEISGYGKDHPLALLAGHDINYLARSGALSLIRDREGRPVIPQNIIADYASGGSLSLNAILAALYAREKSGKGRQVSLSMTAGIQYLMTDIAAATLLAGHASENWRPTLSGGVPSYDVYQTSDCRWMAVGALEPKFITILADSLNWPELTELMMDKQSWPQARAGLEVRFAEKTRDQWAAIFDGLDACVAPVLSVEEVDHRGFNGIDAVFGWRAD